MTWRVLALVFLPTAILLVAWMTAAAFGDGCRTCLNWSEWRTG